MGNDFTGCGVCTTAGSLAGSGLFIGSGGSLVGSAVSNLVGADVVEVEEPRRQVKRWHSLSVPASW